MTRISAVKYKAVLAHLDRFDYVTTSVCTTHCNHSTIATKSDNFWQNGDMSQDRPHTPVLKNHGVTSAPRRPAQMDSCLLQPSPHSHIFLCPTSTEWSRQLIRANRNVPLSGQQKGTLDFQLHGLWKRHENTSFWCCIPDFCVECIILVLNTSF